MGQQQHFRVANGLLLNFVHMIRHNWTDGLAGSKKEICYIDFVVIKILGNGFSILVNQTEICNAMVFFLMLNGTVHQFIIHLCRLVNRQYFYGIQNVVKQGDNNTRQYKEGDNEEFVFFKKGFHSIVIVRTKVQHRTGNFGDIFLKSEVSQ